MKLAISNDDFVEDLLALANISTLNDGDQKWVNDQKKGYIYLSAGVVGSSGVVPNNGSGAWTPYFRIKYGTLIYLVDAGYDFAANNATDVSTIENWHKYGSHHVDYIYTRGQIKDLVTGAGYATLTDQEKKIALQYFVAGPGNDYVDALYTTAEHSANYQAFRDFMQKTREQRDDNVADYLSKLIYTGQITVGDVERMIIDSYKWRRMWLRDGVAGIGHGSTVPGYLNFIMNNNVFDKQAVVSVSLTNDFIEISGSFMEYVKPGFIIKWVDSTDNDGYYMVNEAIYRENNNRTRISLAEDITLSTGNKGSVYLTGLKVYSFYSDTVRDTVREIIEDGKTDY